MAIVGIVEDNIKIRDLIQRYLDMQEDMDCPVAKDSVEEMLEYLEKHQAPDVLLMDIQLPGMTGIKGMEIIKSKYPDIDIIMLTVYHDSHKIFDSLKAGASGYLLKHTSLPEIKESIDNLLKGGAPMSPQIARKVITHFNDQAPQKNPDSMLTDREQDIVNGLVDGLSYKLIADRFSISIDTVRAHIRNIYKKLHVNSKAEVIAKSLRGEI
ncbi:MAG TPA: DNA-binding response regulator [Balneola sp.]|jgi:DNA-binding NarL/FixJ family response regulator|nr:DNA-binding response regulator [Bacteroidota bacterium]MAC06121.1 DNA-binding response regulator [Balneola sp.]MAO78477.1 DNA-binding response regulator [Balneola sp.]MBF64842.1 DNA-binding response regulator [Balneola sp.]HBZ37944.1 DNA-binding response regulator [Balneola sp.]|tara:strand:- start:20481 stop:21113 length:633 start_codon:yes stop_codon:yes gene_type:complete